MRLRKLLCEAATQHVIAHGTMPRELWAHPATIDKLSFEFPKYEMWKMEPLAKQGHYRFDGYLVRLTMHVPPMAFVTVCQK